MIYITGDTHGEFERIRDSKKEREEAKARLKMLIATGIINRSCYEDLLKQENDDD
jgi:hypothetical protein